MILFYVLMFIYDNFWTNDLFKWTKNQPSSAFSREKSHMEDLRSTIDSTISSESEDSDQNATVVPAKPKLTARERLRLKKMQEADKRAYDLK